MDRTPLPPVPVDETPRKTVSPFTIPAYGPEGATAAEPDREANVFGGEVVDREPSGLAEFMMEIKAPLTISGKGEPRTTKVVQAKPRSPNGYRYENSQAKTRASNPISSCVSRTAVSHTDVSRESHPPPGILQMPDLLRRAKNIRHPASGA